MKEAGKSVLRGEKQDAELAARKRLYQGWADGMKPLCFARVDRMLSAKVRYNGRMLTKRDYIIELVCRGYKPERQKLDDIQSVARNGQIYWKAKNRYYMVGESGRHRVCRMEYEFAAFLTDAEEI